MLLHSLNKGADIIQLSIELGVLYILKSSSHNIDSTDTLNNLVSVLNWLETQSSDDQKRLISDIKAITGVYKSQQPELSYPPLVTHSIPTILQDTNIPDSIARELRLNEVNESPQASKERKRLQAQRKTYRSQRQRSERNKLNAEIQKDQAEERAFNEKLSVSRAQTPEHVQIKKTKRQSSERDEHVVHTDHIPPKWGLLDTLNELIIIDSDTDEEPTRHPRLRRKAAQYVDYLIQTPQPQRTPRKVAPKKKYTPKAPSHLEPALEQTIERVPTPNQAKIIKREKEDEPFVIPDWYFSLSQRTMLVGTEIVYPPFMQDTNESFENSESLLTQSQISIKIETLSTGYAFDEWQLTYKLLANNSSQFATQSISSKQILLQQLYIVSESLTGQALTTTFKQPLFFTNQILFKLVMEKLTSLFQFLSQSFIDSVKWAEEQRLCHQVKLQCASCLCLMLKGTKTPNEWKLLIWYFEEHLRAQSEIEFAWREKRRQDMNIDRPENEFNGSEEHDEIILATPVNPTMSLDDRVLERTLLSLSFILENSTRVTNVIREDPQDFCERLLKLMISKPRQILFSILRLLRSVVQSATFFHPAFLELRPSYLFHRCASTLIPDIARSNWAPILLWTSLVKLICGGKGQHTIDLAETGIINDIGLFFELLHRTPAKRPLRLIPTVPSIQPTPSTSADTNEINWWDDVEVEEGEEKTKIETIGELGLIIDAVLSDRKMLTVSSDGTVIVSGGVVGALLNENVIVLEKVLWHLSEYLARIRTSVKKVFDQKAKQQVEDASRVSDDRPLDEREDNDPESINRQPSPIPSANITIEVVGEGISEEELAAHANEENQQKMRESYPVVVEYSKCTQKFIEKAIVQILNFHLESPHAGEYKKISTWARIVLTRLLEQP
ncbi:hypothetical protein BLNAU_4517 [Blattamonas nauphoetae]|uniref:Uncharacterized protein n=1 Tax=Blattamonas nauphoetae TaxID=2049346 RepID=A0ABQ9YAE4_9EUKA|nr:hypothetical protein BLNAU_4517 [Blattamonas nauphoetae]